MSARVPALVALLALAGCSMSSLQSGDFGVTPGGSQDMGYARGLIEAGQIPDQEHFTAEGLFSEHDLPLAGPACESVLCPRAATTIHRPLEGDAKVLVQLGFGTRLNASNFERADLDLVLLVDTSGSMSGAPLDQAKEAMAEAVGRLDAHDRVGLVEFGSKAKVLRSSAVMDESGRNRLLAAIDKLETNGSTDMESGMRKAFDQLDLSFDGSHRLMIFSDAQPNTGLTSESDFVKLVRSQAAKGVGVTFIGIGPNLGTELADVISKVRGGNSFFLAADSVHKLFVDEFDFMVTPLAYDLEVSVRSLEGVTLGDEVYGAPVDGDEVAFGASTLFLSARNGGMAATFDLLPDAPVALGNMDLSYLEVDAGSRTEDSVAVRWDGGTFLDEADDLGVYKIELLVNEVKALTAAAEACDETRDPASALAVIDDARSRIDAAAVALEGDAGLTREAELMEALAALVDTDGPLPCAPADVWDY